jgi:NAD(P)-dependent dehydrogenase (short-subunit alcohol dehydrogenase family)
MVGPRSGPLGAPEVVSSDDAAETATRKMPAYDFTGRVAVVTGGGVGIGRAAAILFAEHGASVAIVGRTEGPCVETVKLIEEAGGQASFVRCDVSVSQDVQHMVDETVRTYGRLDFAYNNAGVAQAGASITDLDEAEWDRVIATNLTGVFLCMKYEIRQMVAQGTGGAVVNASSAAGVKGFASIPSYTASKFGLNGMSRGVALDFAAKGIRVNVVGPASVDTPMMRANPGTAERFASISPNGRLSDPREIAEAVVWLCSDAASFVTGAVLPVDAGLTA